MLVEAGPRLLPAFPAEVSEAARRDLEQLGVEVRAGASVTEVTAAGVIIGGEPVAARTVFWAAGNAASPLGRMLGAELDRAGRVLVADDLSVPAHPEIFVAGDLAAVHWEHDAWVPGVAPAAMQMGRLAGLNARRRLASAPTELFRYRNKGEMATIGRNAAVAVIGRLHLSGYPAWLTWLLAHIYFLINFRNRLVVMIDWAWAYWTFHRYARIIIKGP